MSKFLRSRPEISIVLPTFNESANIRPLVQRLQTVVAQNNLEAEYLFVDDSFDDTADIIREQQRLCPNISLLKREGKEAKTGLTRAFQAGFAQAKGEFIVCMDTDLQHPPEK